MNWTDDPLRDADCWMREQENRLELLPKCCCCDEPIQDDEAVCLDGEWFCAECELDAWPDIRKHYLAKVVTE